MTRADLGSTCARALMLSCALLSWACSGPSIGECSVFCGSDDHCFVGTCGADGYCHGDGALDHCSSGQGADPKLVIDRAELRVLRGPARGQKTELGTDSLLIGSSPECDLVLHDDTVSARHAEVTARAQGGYLICDLGSTNGLRLAGFAIERAPLADGMEIELGETTLVVRALGAQRAVPLSQAGRFGGLVAHSVKMRALVAALEELARSSATVLIEGETGTGKEVAAEALHAASARARGPFVTFDCGAVAPTLAAAELFGHERGAFTGADEARAGLLEQARGGTLLLDEISELPLELQPLLLRVLERKRARRLGGRAELQHDVRIVAATNRNLLEEVRAKRFREDLYYRLAVARLKLPPLRERLEDLPLLASTFAREAGGALPPDALALLQAYPWPGNVRELRNTVVGLVVQPELAREALAEATHQARRPRALFDAAGRLLPLPEVRRRVATDVEREYLEEVLARAQGNLSHAAELAGVTRQYLTTLSHKHALHPRGRRSRRLRREGSEAAFHARSRGRRSRRLRREGSEAAFHRPSAYPSAPRTRAGGGAAKAVVAEHRAGAERGAACRGEDGRHGLGLTHGPGAAIEVVARAGRTVLVEVPAQLGGVGAEGDPRAARDGAALRTTRPAQARSARSRSRVP